MKRVLLWLINLVTVNVGWKLLSLAIAVAIWAMVATEPELSTFSTVAVEYKNLPESLEMGTDPVTSVVLELRGPAGELRGVGDGGHPAVILDMSGVGPGKRTFPVGARNVRLPPGVRLVLARPAELRFDFEERLVRTVPVVVRFAGEGKNGYMVARAEAAPQSVQIVGPANHVSLVRAAVTEPMDVSELDGPEEFHVNAFVEDAFVRIRASPQIAVAVTMKKK